MKLNYYFTPATLKLAREYLRLSARECAEFISMTTTRAWNYYEAGVYEIPDFVHEDMFNILVATYAACNNVKVNHNKIARDLLKIDEIQASIDKAKQTNSLLKVVKRYINKAK